MLLYAFDLDLTLTDKDTLDNTIEGSWHSKTNFNDVKQMLQNLKSHKHKIAVVTRGVHTEVIDFLHNINILKYFDVVVGSENKAETYEMSDDYWGVKKTNVLKALQNSLKIENTKDIFFFDDKLYNIIPCKTAGFTAVHVMPFGSKSLLKFIEKHNTKHI
jgi:HAD superfamily phosphatase (TIGR01681 family)